MTRRYVLRWRSPRRPPRWPRRASPRPGSTRSCSPRPCSVSAAARLALARRASDADAARPVRRRWWRAGRAREPLQHLHRHRAASGTSSSRSGPGCSCPRPETELLVGWGIDAGCAAGRPPTRGRRPVRGLRRDRPGRRARAARRAGCRRRSDPRRRWRWLRRNAAARAAGETPVEVVAADVTDARPARRAGRPGRPGAVQPAVRAGRRAGAGRGRRARPARGGLRRAGRAGGDPSADRPRAARCCAPAGVLGIEHDETHATSVPALLAADGRFTEVTGHHDLAGRPRFTTARLAEVRRSARPPRRGRLAHRDALRLPHRSPSATGASPPPSRRSRAASWSCCPTDTVYGIGADAFNPYAVKALLDAKGRGRHMPPPVLVGSRRTLDGLVSDAAAGGPGPGRGVLARRADHRRRARAEPAVGPGGHVRHGGGADAAAPGGAGGAAARPARWPSPRRTSTGRPAAVTAAEARDQLGYSVRRLPGGRARAPIRCRARSSI